jgi:hypothetical protein
MSNATDGSEYDCLWQHVEIKTRVTVTKKKIMARSKVRIRTPE